MWNEDCGVSKLGEKQEANFTVGFQVSYENPKHDGAFHEAPSVKSRGFLMFSLYLWTENLAVLSWASCVSFFAVQEIAS